MTNPKSPPSPAAEAAGRDPEATAILGGDTFRPDLPAL